MAPIQYNIYINFNGEIVHGQNGVEYQDRNMKIIRVKHGIKFSEWERTIISALQLGKKSHGISITYRCPQEIHRDRIIYMPLLITDNNGVNLKFDVID